MTADLFGTPIDDARAVSAKRKHFRAPNGYAAAPGTGPAGATCKGCKHAYAVRFAKTYHKCALVKPTRGSGTDIRLRSPACSRFEVST